MILANYLKVYVIRLKFCDLILKPVCSEGPLVIDEVEIAVLALTDPAGKSRVSYEGLDKVDLSVGVLPFFEIWVELEGS